MKVFNLRLNGPILAVLAVILFLPFISAQAQQGTLVETEPLKNIEFHDQITLVGRTEAWISGNIVAEISGQVESVDAAEGVWVKADTPLIKVDAEQLRYNLNAKTAEAKEAQYQANLANTHLERARELFSQNLISQAGMDSALAWAGIEQARSARLEAERKKLEVDLRNAAIRAPYDGFTGRKLTDVGQWVTPGQPVFEMVDLSKIRVRVDLPERYFGQLSIGSDASISASINGHAEIIGTVTGISPNASAEAHTFPVIIEVDNSDGYLGGGMLVRSRVNLNKSFTSLAVSKDAIIRQGDQTMIYTIDEGKAAPIPVTIGSTSRNYVAVSGEGIAEGMPVVVRGNERIFPGSPVMTADQGEAQTSNDISSDQASNN